MSINPLNDISKVYLEQVANTQVDIEEGMTLQDYKKKRSALKQKEKRGMEKTSPTRRKGIHNPERAPEREARRSAAGGETGYGGALRAKKVRKAKALGEIGESAVPGKPAEKLGAVTAIPKSEQEAARERVLAKAAAMRAKKGITKEELDTATSINERSDEPGERDSNPSVRAHNRAVGYKPKSKRPSLSKNPRYGSTGEQKPVDFSKFQGGYKESLDPVGREDKDIDNDGDHDKSDKYLLNRRKVRGAAIAKKKTVKEGFSNWREELSEVAEFISKDKNDQKITEKKVSNKIKINPTIGEAVENLGGTLLEMVEVDELDYILESAYDELLEEGYEEDDIEEALEFALTEAKVTYGHDTAPKATEKKKEGLLSAARKRLSGVKKAAKQAVATGARKVAKGALGVARKMEAGDGKPSAAHTKTRAASTYRGAGAGQKEKVSSGSYTGPAKKKAEPVKDPWEGSATTPPKSKAKKVAAKPKATTKTAKAPAKKKRSSNLDKLIASVRSEQVQIDEKVLSAVETKKKEELVKSMKKKADDFEARYPGRGKEVMYATATKMAKKMAEQALELQPKEQKPTVDKSQEAKAKASSQKAKQAEINILQRKLQAIRSTPAGTTVTGFGG